MLDVKTTVLTALQTIGIDVQYEMFYNGTSVPCITYYEYSNKDDKTGDTFGYSTIGITVTVWANSISDLETKSQLVDTKMRSLGFKRINTNEIVQGTVIRKVIDYKCIAKETY